MIETTPAESVVTYVGLLASIALLLASFLIFSVLRGGLQTNSNSIHKNVALCLLCAQLVFLTALKLRQRLVLSEVRSPRLLWLPALQLSASHIVLDEKLHLNTDFLFCTYESHFCGRIVTYDILQITYLYS